MNNRVLVAAACDAQQVQAQQATEPELPEAVAWQGRWLDHSDDAGGWSEWRAIDTIDLPRWQKRVTNKPGCYKIRALYTTAKMHDHYQAGVRAGMGQSQWQPIETAPKDGRSFDVWVKSTKNPDYGVRMTGVYYVQGVLCGSKLPNSSWCEYASHWMPLPEPPAMQGDNHDQRHKRTGVSHDA